MPELPEVEAARRAVEAHCKGGLVRRAVVADDAKVVEGMAAAEMQRVLEGKKIVAAHRKGKQLWVEFDQPPSLCFQFGMTGAVQIKGVKVSKYVRSAVKDEDEWPSKFSKVLLELDDGVEMSFTDKRRFARVRLLDNPATSPPVSELGPDAFKELPEEAAFAEAVLKKKLAIKAVLLDQSFLAGIGNWIADEVLYQSRIHPEQPASTLTAEDCKRLRGAIKEVLETAVGAEAEPSKYPEGWIFHHREKKSSNKSLDGKNIEFITVGGRTSAYVPELQKYEGLETRRRAPRRGKLDKDDGNDADEPEEKPKRRGRSAAKKPTSKAEQGDSDEQEVKEEPKKRGAQSKKASAAEQDEEEDPADEQEVPKKRGAQSKKASAAKKAKQEEEEPSDEQEVKKEPKKRGAQSKKASAAEKAEQEEEEDEGEVKKEPKKRGPKKGGAQSKKAKQEEEDATDEQEEPKKGGAQAKNDAPAKKTRLKAVQEEEEDPSDEQEAKKEPKKRGAQSKKASEENEEGRPKKRGTQSKKASEDEEEPSKGPKKRGKASTVKKQRKSKSEKDDSEAEKQESADEEEPKKAAKQSRSRKASK